VHLFQERGHGTAMERPLERSIEDARGSGSMNDDFSFDAEKSTFQNSGKRCTVAKETVVNGKHSLPDLMEKKNAVLTI
jgi:hypothetical protein